MEFNYGSLNGHDQPYQTNTTNMEGRGDMISDFPIGQISQCGGVGSLSVSAQVSYKHYKYDLESITVNGTEVVDFIYDYDRADMDEGLLDKVIVKEGNIPSRHHIHLEL